MKIVHDPVGCVDAVAGDVLPWFGGVTVEEARKVRPGIEIDASTPERAAAQPKW